MSKTENKAESNNIDDLWEEYRKKVVPKSAPDFQIRDTKAAFMAGANVVCSLVASLDKNQLADDLSRKVFEQIELDSATFILSCAIDEMWEGKLF